MKKDYSKFIEQVLRKDPEFGERLRLIQAAIDECRKFVVKQKSAVSHSFWGLLAENPQDPKTKSDAPNGNGNEPGVCAHVSLIGKPGTAKTVISKTVAGVIKASYARIQGTSDLLACVV